MIDTKRTIWTSLAVAAIAAAATVALLVPANGPATAAADEPASPADSVRLAALSVAPSEEDVPFLQQDFLSETGHDLARARLLATDVHGSQVIAVPRLVGASHGEDDEFCLIVTEASAPTRGAGACTSADGFNREGVFVTLSRGNPDTDEVVGILPDGIAAVSITSSAREMRIMNVYGNVVRFRHRGATSVTLAGQDGTVRRPIAPGLTG
jgi:hypothetical protein